MKLNKIWLLIIYVLIITNSIFSQSLISHEEKYEIITEVCSLLREYYVYPEIAEKICDILINSLKDGRYDKATNYDEFTDILNEDLQSVYHDPHLESYWVPESLKDTSKPQNPISISLRYISRHKNSNFGITHVELMDNNVGYLEILTFRPLPNPEAERIVRSAMDFLSNCDALIIDLRQNLGGHVNMLQFLSSYFFEKLTQLSTRYLRETSSTYESWTIKNFYNQRLVDVPLFILTSKSTISAPEIFSYDLQALKRATIVGEVTAGAVNSGRYFSIKNSIQLLITIGYTINPITKTHCEGKGVQPDVVVPAEDALDKALELANIAAEQYRQKKENMVEEYIQKFQSQITEVEKEMVKNFDKAEEMLNKIIRQWYDNKFMNPYLLLDLGDMYLQKDQAQMAILVLKQGPLYYTGAFEMYIFYRMLAEAYLKISDKKNAVKSYAKYLELFPNDSTVIQKLKAISDETIKEPLH